MRIEHPYLVLLRTKHDYTRTEVLARTLQTAWVPNANDNTPQDLIELMQQAIEALDKGLECDDLLDHIFAEGMK